MRRQPPGDNNPANPLLKVAALDLNKEYIGTGNARRIKVKATLNFNKSDAVRGRTQSYNGQSVNIVFELSIRRATFALSCADDKGNSLEKFVDIEDVAYVGSSIVSEEIIEKTSSKSSSNKSTTGDLSGSLKARFSRQEGLASLKGSAAIKNEHKDEIIGKVNRKVVGLNVSATHAGSTVNWQIGIVDPLSVSTANHYLRGEVFKSEKNGKQINACVIKRNDKGPLAHVVLSGSLMVTMENLVIGNVTITDDDGEIIDWQDIKSNERKSNFFGAIFRPEDAKKRIIKQIIRKHLLQQGMKTDGALVEICRASA